MGIWNPKDAQEIAAAKNAANIPIVLGFCVGNEGLRKRYQLSELSETINNLKKATNKPVTTTEEVDDYGDARVLSLGDWIFPNVHPYFHNWIEPNKAVRWTKEAFKSFKNRTNKFVLFKEVGLPTAGDSQGRVSEKNQMEYYVNLAKTDVRFVYFEGFDQPWKTYLPIEPHWGIFRSDRSPKRLGTYLIETRTQASQ